MNLEDEEKKAKIKYFRILPFKCANDTQDEKKIRKYDYLPGTTLELRPGDIENELISLERLRRKGDNFSNDFLKSVGFWDYRKPFNISEWIKMLKPITFTEDGICELYYTMGDRIFIGNRIKSKILELFAKRKAPWDNRGQFINNCKLLFYLVDNRFIKNIGNSTSKLAKYSEEDIMDFIKKKWSFQTMEDREIYSLIFEENFFAKAKIFAGTQEVYESDYDEFLYIPFSKDETWDISKEREILLGIINQPFYEMLAYNAQEIQGAEKDELYKEEFKNRIKILRQRGFYNKIYYQAIDDDVANDNILKLKEEGYKIEYDSYNSNNQYQNGNVKYFSYICPRGEEDKIEFINQFADQLTDQEARRIFPEDFYYERAYYQVRKPGGYQNTYDINNVEYYDENKENLYPNGDVKFFWIDYYGTMDDFEKRKQVLKFADELPVETAIELRRKDEITYYQKEKEEEEKSKIKKFMNSPKFKKNYQKVRKKANSEKIPTKIEFAKNQLEENKKHLRQKRLNDEGRTRKVSIEEMLAEIQNIVQNRYFYRNKLDKELYYKLYNEIDLDDVIQLLSDVMMTEEQATCVAISWNLLQKINEKDITQDFIESEQVRELFSELYEKTDINEQIAQVIASSYNCQMEELKKQRLEEHNKKVQNLKSLKIKESVFEL